MSSRHLWQMTDRENLHVNFFTETNVSFNSIFHELFEVSSHMNGLSCLSKVWCAASTSFHESVPIILTQCQFVPDFVLEPLASPLFLTLAATHGGGVLSRGLPDSQGAGRSSRLTRHVSHENSLQAKYLPFPWKHGFEQGSSPDNGF